MRDLETPLWLIGTANFGMRYGFASNFSKVPECEVEKIINRLEFTEFRGFDTAQSYGETESLLGKYASNKSRIVFTTKINPATEPKAEALFRSIVKSKERLGRQPVVVYFHSLAHLLEVSPREIVKLNERLTGAGLITEIGVSVYQADEVSHVLDLYGNIENFQVPMNFMVGQNYIDSISKLTSLGINFVFRSIFLQGILLTAPSDSRLRRVLRKDELQELTKLWEFAVERGFSMLDLCLYHAKTVAEASGVVVGVSSLEEFTDITASLFKVSQGLEVDVPRLDGEFEKGFFDLRESRFNR